MRSIESVRNALEHPNHAEAAEAAQLRGGDNVVYLPVVNTAPTSFDQATVALTQWVIERFNDLDPKDLAEFLVFGCTWKHDSH